MKVITSLPTSQSDIGKYFVSIYTHACTCTCTFKHNLCEIFLFLCSFLIFLFLFPPPLSLSLSPSPSPSPSLPSQGVPNQVTIVEIQYLSLFEIVIAWYIPSSNFGLNQGYNVEYRLELTGANSSNITVEEPYHILTDLDVNRNYSAVISSFNEVGRGPFSDVIIFPSISSGGS